MKRCKEWFLTTELLNLPGMPNTVSGINYKAKNENWTKRKPEGVKGRAFEYNLKSLPHETQKAIEATHKTNVVNELVSQFRSPKAKNETVSIPYYDVSASAGNGLLPFEESNVQYTMEIHPQILLDLGISSQNLLCMPVKGDSMEPSLFEGDIVLVQRLQKPYSVLEGIHVIRIDNDIFIKHIQFNRFESKLKINSENHLYDSYYITGEDLNQVEIIGEALCKLGKIRMKSSPLIPTAS